MGSIDLKDAYYSISIYSDHQKYLKFSWGNKLDQFTCLAQGHACGPRLFAKRMKSVFAFLRERGNLTSGYLDDSVLAGYSYSECQSNFLDTINLLKVLGVYPHENKSVTSPTQIIQHLGFVLNFIEMNVSMTDAKIAKLTETTRIILSKTGVGILLVAKLIGHIVSCFPAVEFGEQLNRQVEIDKSTALKAAK